MSLFVKGAKLPKIEGDKSIKAEIRCVGGKWEFGIMTGGYYCSQEWTFYPLSELPPHGKLGDLDALSKALRDEALQHTIIGDLNRMALGAGEVIDRINSAPTIIPAEEG